MSRTRSGPIAVVAGAALAVGVMGIATASAFAGGTITIDNQSSKTLKVAAPGGHATIEANVDPVSVAFETDAEVGVSLKAWWASEPRQLCQIFTPWGRTVVVSGTRTIRCLSR